MPENHVQRNTQRCGGDVISPQTFSFLNLEKKLFFLSFFSGEGDPASGNAGGSNLFGAAGQASSVGPLERKKSARSPVLLCS